MAVGQSGLGSRNVGGRARDRIGRALFSAAPILALSVAVAVVYLTSPVTQSGDGRLVLYEAKSVLHDGNLDLHEYGPSVEGFPCYSEGERVLSRYPYGTALLIAPLLAIVQASGSLIGDDPTAGIRERAPVGLEKALASIIAALAVGALMLMAREALARTAPALLLGVLFAFGTGMWSTVSRGLFQHGPLILLTGLGLFCLVRGRNRGDWRWSAAAGLPLGAAYVVRPTAAAVIALTALVLLITNRRAFLGFAAAGACVLVPSIAYNLWVYGSPAIPFYFESSGFLSNGVRATFLEGAAGTMVSPGRGLLVYSPFVVLAVAGLWLQRRRIGSIEIVSAGSVLAIWLLAANTVDWPGGRSYGPRLLTDTFPFIAYLMLPVLDEVTRPMRTWSRPTAALAAVLALGFAWGAFVNARGALSWSTQLWNTRPTAADIGANPKRLWEWEDPAFLRTGNADQRDLYPSGALPTRHVDAACPVD